MATRTATTTRTTSRTHIRALSAATGGLLLATTLVAGCSGPGGVDLGDDWAGSQTFVVAHMSGLTTVIGINPVKHHAEPLLVVPQHRDDDQVTAPQLTRMPRAGAEPVWLLTVPRTGDHPARLYTFTASGRSLDGAGDVEGQRTLVPDGNGRLAAVGSSGDTAASGPAPSSALRYTVNLSGASADTLTARQDVPLGAPTTLTAGGAHQICATADTPAGTKVITLTAESTVPATTAPASTLPAGIQATALDCSGTRVTVGGTADTLPAPPIGDTAAMLHLTHAGSVDVVIADSETVGRVLDVPGGVLVGTYGPKGSALTLLSRQTGDVVAQVALPNVPTVDGLALTRQSYVVTGGDQAAAVSLDLASSAPITLPAQVVASP